MKWYEDSALEEAKQNGFELGLMRGLPKTIVVKGNRWLPLWNNGLNDDTLALQWLADGGKAVTRED